MFAIKKKRSQPLVPCGIDRSNPLTKGLSFAVSGSMPTVDLANNFVTHLNGSGAIQTPSRQAVYATATLTSSSVQFGLLPDSLFTGPISIVASFYASQSRLIARKSSADATQNPFSFSFETGQNGLYLVRAGSNYGAYKPNSVAASVNTFETVCVVSNGSMSWTTPQFYSKFSPNDIGAIRVYTGGNTDITGSSQPITVLFGATGTFLLEFLFIFSRAITGAEYREIALDPWALFLQGPQLRRQYFFPTGAIRYGRPISDESVQWTPSTGSVNYALLADEDAGTYIYATGSAVDVYRCTAMDTSQMTNPQISFEVPSGFTPSGTVTVQLWQGNPSSGTKIAEKAVVDPTAGQTYTASVTGTITDGSDLWWRVVSS